jgi:hypothetical protein
MGFLKGFGTYVCNSLLFLVLAFFSMAYMLNSTVLSADFVTRQVDNIDIASVAPDISEKLVSEEMPPEAELLKDVALDVISEQEPWIKEQLDSAVNTGYDFFLGESDTLSITIPLVELKTSLKDSLWNAVQDHLGQQLSGMSDYEIKRYLQDYMGQIPEENLPPELAALPEDERNTAIEQYLRELGGLEMTEAIPAAISNQFEGLMKEYFDQYYAEFISDIPDSYTIDESTIGSDTMDTFFTVRKYIGYFQTYYPWAIVFMVVMAGLIFLINWGVKAPARSLGINLLVFGVLNVAVAIVFKVISPMQLIQKIIPDFSEIPASVQNIADGVSNDVLSISLTFGIGVLVVGVILLVASFVVGRLKKKTEVSA